MFVLRPQKSYCFYAILQGVLDATKAAFNAVCPDESWMKKLISFGADGASVNMGHRGGVITLLQREAGEYIIPIHYMPHRFVTGKNGYVVADIHAHLSHACVHTT